MKASEALQQTLEQQLTIFNSLFGFVTINNIFWIAIIKHSYIFSCIASLTLVPNTTFQMSQTLSGALWLLHIASVQSGFEVIKWN